MAHIISGIQQAGIGVTDVKKAYRWYSHFLGMDIPIFEEAAIADRMLPYTGGIPHERHAVLAINIKGGGGFEIWQYTSRLPQPPAFDLQPGDIGIYAVKIKSDNVKATHAYLKNEGLSVTDIHPDPSGAEHFYLHDDFGNIFEVIKGEDWFARGLKHTGGVAGAVLGVKDMEKSIRFYRDLLGYDKLVFRGESQFDDLKALHGGGLKLERAILTHSEKRKGPFSPLLGNTFIELIRSSEREPKRIFGGRLWGDLGFIHLCFDVRNMTSLKKKSEQIGHPFTVDGGIEFDMGEAKGHFCYVEDPDGTLIEFVEAKKIPILKRFGWYLDLKKRPAARPLPKWMLRALKFNRKTEI
jgi:catechol 2,3-dioxygenase-like lactoylglutathione lyase family enzyme